ncbi:MAG: Dna2/Cas4 domain-containing protein, partial [Saprospiraceae bacterium]|nr:Dna2/Cas4 domain-containing protein [Saprospiraceae bacterium]
YYLHKLTQYGIEGAIGILEYPMLRHTTHVELTLDDVMQIKTWENDIEHIIASKHMPPVINKTICKKCSYYDFCYC